jgi:hypothetical protein
MVVTSVQQIGSSVVDQRRLAWQGLTFFLIAFLFLASMSPYYKNLRLTSAAAVSYYALCGIGCWRVADGLRRVVGTVSASWTLVLLVLAAVAIGDYKNFHEVFVRLERNDLVIPHPYLERSSIYRGLDWFR